MLLTAQPSVLLGTAQKQDAAFLRVPSGLKFCLVFVLMGVSILGIGLNLGVYYVGLSSMALYLLMMVMLGTGCGKLDTGSFVAYILAVCFSVLGLVFNADGASAPSAFLLAFLYLPFVFTVTPKLDVGALWRWTLGAFCNIGLFCAFAGIVQFAAQFIIHERWLFDPSVFLPEILQPPAAWNRIIPAGSFFKSNGFFFLEPSIFSQFMAANLICEWNLQKRWWRMGVIGFAILLSYSGTGLLALLFASMFPLNYKTLFRFLLIGLAAVTVLFLFGDALNLWFTVERLGEFSTEGTSAYARFVAPFRLLAERFTYEVWTPFFGNGPGSISRTVADFEFHDPTWAKLLYEYGLLGTAAIMTLVMRGIMRFPIPAQVRAVLFFSWFACGGQLLSPGSTALMYVILAAWPRPQDKDGGNEVREGVR